MFEHSECQASPPIGGQTTKCSHMPISLQASAQDQTCAQVPTSWSAHQAPRECTCGAWTRLSTLQGRGVLSLVGSSWCRWCCVLWAWHVLRLPRRVERLRCSGLVFGMAVSATARRAITCRFIGHSSDAYLGSFGAWGWAHVALRPETYVPQFVWLLSILRSAQGCARLHEIAIRSAANFRLSGNPSIDVPRHLSSAGPRSLSKAGFGQLHRVNVGATTEMLKLAVAVATVRSSTDSQGVDFVFVSSSDAAKAERAAVSNEATGAYGLTKLASEAHVLCCLGSGLGVWHGWPLKASIGGRGTSGTQLVLTRVRPAPANQILCRSAICICTTRRTHHVRVSGSKARTQIAPRRLPLTPQFGPDSSVQFRARCGIRCRLHRFSSKSAPRVVMRKCSTNAQTELPAAPASKKMDNCSASAGHIFFNC